MQTLSKKIHQFCKKTPVIIVKRLLLFIGSDVIVRQTIALHDKKSITSFRLRLKGSVFLISMTDMMQRRKTSAYSSG